MRGDKIKFIVLLTILLLYVIITICTLVGWNHVLSNRTIRKILARPMRVGAIYIDHFGDAEYSLAHDDAMDAAVNQLGERRVTLIKKTEVSAADVTAVMEQMINDGCELIFADAYDYQDAAIELAKKYPDIYFAVAAGEKTAPNVTSYWGRDYQIRYLTGILTGLMLKDGCVGYVAGFKIPQVIRGLNAFALGVRSVNPQLTVKVIWVNHWNDASICRDATLLLLQQGANLIAQHVDTVDPALVAVQCGKLTIGHNMDFRKFLNSPNILTSFVWNWMPFLFQTMQDVLEEHWHSQLYWGGLKDGMIDITKLSELVPTQVQEKIAQTRQALIKHDTVFCGELRDNHGQMRQQVGQCLSDQELLTIDWLVEGVEEVTL